MLPIFINGIELSNVTEHHDLGIVFSDNLTWFSHVDSTVAKAYKTFGLLHRTFKNTTSIQVKKNILSKVQTSILFCLMMALSHEGHFVA